ncbi:MAG: hypothetical protein ACI91O_000150 [Candidatus Poriferisodalaceae bacterium]|jgi:hypothetical protein
MGAAQDKPQSDSHTLESEGFKYVADMMVGETDIEPLLH